MGYLAEEQQLRSLLGLRSAPIAVAYRPGPPEGVPRVGAAGPSGCSYWKRAAAGDCFYTEASDHYGCPVGAYTHHVDLPETQAAELEGLIKIMVGLEYLREEEIPQIPRRDTPLGVAIYAPLSGAPVSPDVIVLCGNARQMMLLTEAAGLAGVPMHSGLMGRPTCAALPLALQSRQLTASVGCIGNRVYTELPDDELYFALPGAHLDAVVAKLATIVHANRELEQFHRARAEAG